MQSIERGTRPSTSQQSPTAGERVLPSQREAHRMLVRAAWGAAVLLIILAAGFLAFGCGQQNQEQASVASQSPAAATPTQAGAMAVPASAPGSAKIVREPNSEALAAVSADSLPPDVAASVSDMPVVPGAAIEITAQGSPDVVAVTLGDGRGHLQAFAYDSNADLWRVAYRVPVKIKTDRPALSVTARNASGRWRRVWLFLDVAGRAQASGWLKGSQAAAPDTVTDRP